MFDDTTNSNQPASPRPPINLPTSQTAANEPEDILANVEVEKPTVERPVQPVGTAPRQSSSFNLTSNVPATEPTPMITERQEPFFSRYKGFFTLLGVLIVVSALATGGWYVYSRYFSLPQIETLNSNQSNINQAAEQPATNQNQVGQPANTNAAIIGLDSDQDGLTDSEEALYGTDPNKVDTDGDGLADRDEVRVFKTDPLNPDTDLDGFNDGIEIQNGYDPKGPGKLLQIPQ